MTSFPREQLVAAMNLTHPAEAACHDELMAGALLLTRGSDHTVPTAGLVKIYKRRVERLQVTGIRFVGNDVTDRLAGCGLAEIRGVSVHGRDNYTVFLHPTAMSVVACIGVDGAIANQAFDWSAEA